MNISNDLKEYIEMSSKNLESDILYTDLDSVLFFSSNSYNDSFIKRNLSNELLLIINTWKNASYKNDLIMIYNLCCIPLIKDDRNKYSAQIILPLCHNDELKGLLIFFRKEKNYIPSSSKAAITTKIFVENLSYSSFNNKNVDL